jgi:hypothetical protein
LIKEFYDLIDYIDSSEQSALPVDRPRLPVFKRLIFLALRLAKVDYDV